MAETSQKRFVGTRVGDSNTPTTVFWLCQVRRLDQPLTRWIGQSDRVSAFSNAVNRLRKTLAHGHFGARLLSRARNP
jgi:hypothetical protein